MKRYREDLTIRTVAKMPIRVRMTIGTTVFVARVRHDLAPLSSERVTQLLPYRGQLIHARWSGEACWSPLAAVWPVDSLLPEENALRNPAPGQILLYVGELSEPELFIPYGANSFACKAGPLAGNPVLTIEDVSALAELGRATLWHGATAIRIDFADR